MKAPRPMARPDNWRIRKRHRKELYDSYDLNIEESFMNELLDSGKIVRFRNLSQEEKLKLAYRLMQGKYQFRNKEDDTYVTGRAA